MPRSGLYSARIFVDEVALPEYRKADSVTTLADGSPVHTVFVEAKTKKFFKIKVAAENASETNRIEASMKVDGKKIRSQILRSPRAFFLEGEIIGNIVRPFVFANVELVSEENTDKARAAALLKEQNSKGVRVGEIEVSFWCFKVVSSLSHSHTQAQATSQLKIHEKANKTDLFSHGVSYADPIPSSAISYVNGFRLGSKPLVTFSFQYRSRLLLETKHGFHLPPEPEDLARIALRGDAAVLIPHEFTPITAPRRGMAKLTSDQSKKRPREPESDDTLVDDDDDVKEVSRSSKKPADESREQNQDGKTFFLIDD